MSPASGPAMSHGPFRRPCSPGSSGLSAVLGTEDSGIQARKITAQATATTLATTMSTTRQERDRVAVRGDAVMVTVLVFRQEHGRCEERSYAGMIRIRCGRSLEQLPLSP